MYDHDHHPFHFPSRGKALRKECCVLSVSLSVCLFVIMAMTATLSLSQKRKKALQKKALCDHDPTPFLSLKKRTFEKKALSDHGHHFLPVQEEEGSFPKEGCVLQMAKERGGELGWFRLSKRMRTPS